METFKPLLSKTAPREAQVRPFPKEETTPPVTKMYFVALDFMGGKYIAKLLECLRF